MFGKIGFKCLRIIHQAAPAFGWQFCLETGLKQDPLGGAGGMHRSLEVLEVDILIQVNIGNGNVKISAAANGLTDQETDIQPKLIKCFIHGNSGEQLKVRDVYNIKFCNYSIVASKRQCC